MPTYEYKCLKCGYRFEEFQSITDEPLKVCPACQGELQRVLSGGVGLIFKGSGFYITDYARKNSSSAPKSAPKEKGNTQQKNKKETGSGEKNKK